MPATSAGYSIRYRRASAPAALRFGMPVLRQIVGIIFLTLIAGILILGILRIHNVGLVKPAMLCRAVLAFVMSDIPALLKGRRLLHDMALLES
jgi:hypothetical protein